MRVALLLVLAVVVVGCESLRAPQAVPPPVPTSAGQGERQPNPLTPFASSSAGPVSGASRGPATKEGGTEQNTADVKRSAMVLSPSPLRGGVGEGLQPQPTPPAPLPEGKGETGTSQSKNAAPVSETSFSPF